ncbi:hypothetical protein ML401_35480 (plasmid) [Bradyrhizobium sp. 62B]|uniref:hypothetical protein n=1 Tax=Bradyrhizobium sp. 62B TaxID=2898442 RepID=UPI002557D23C|nr:hypothetical protein ML401_35480 [Bradyrhizobium sp. 62B]
MTIGTSRIVATGDTLKEDVSVASKVSSDAAEAFRIALDGPAVGAQSSGLPPTSVTDKRRVNDVATVSGGHLMGLERLESAMGSMTTIAQRAESAKLGTTELFDLQLSLSVATVRYEMATKVVGKVAQTLDAFLMSQ